MNMDPDDMPDDLIDRMIEYVRAELAADQLRVLANASPPTGIPR
jgi:hypothetical protein